MNDTLIYEKSFVKHPDDKNVVGIVVDTKGNFPYQEVGVVWSNKTTSYIRRKGLIPTEQFADYYNFEVAKKAFIYSRIFLMKNAGYESIPIKDGIEIPSFDLQ